VTKAIYSDPKSPQNGRTADMVLTPTLQ